jgi:hypothetical protein
MSTAFVLESEVEIRIGAVECCDAAWGKESDAL